MAGGAVMAAHEGLPFTEGFDDAHLSDVDNTEADWGARAPGFLTLPTAEPLIGVFDPVANGEDVGTTAHTTRALALADMNGDGLPDLVEGASRMNGVYLNDGNGFPARVDISDDTYNTRGVAVGDVDADGDLDIVAANLNGPPRLYLNAGDGVQYVGSNIADRARADAVALADLNGDGHPDVVVANQNFDHDTIYFHTGNLFAPFGANGVEGRVVHPDMQHNAQVVLAGDLDNDGDMDLVFINEMQQNRAYLNDGAANFTPVPIGAEEDNSQAAALGDLDGDGFLDLVVGSYPPGSINRVYFNSGDPSAPFSAATTPMNFTVANDPSFVHHAKVGDVNNDGHLDIVLATSGEFAAEPGVTRFTNRLYLNDGTGEFSASMDIGADMDVTNTIVIGDVDGDGRADIVAGNEDRDENNDAFEAMNRLYRNIGMLSGDEPVLQLSGYAESLRVDTEAEPISTVSLDAVFDPLGAHSTADFWVSSNGGVNWLPVERGGLPVVIPEGIRGTDLRWRVVLNALSPVDAEALALDSVTLTADAPTFTSVPVMEATVDTAYLYEVAAMDPDAGDTLTLTAPDAPDWLMFTDNGDGTGTLTGTPTADDLGEHPVRLEVSDAAGTTVPQSFTVTVVAPVTDPTFTSAPLTGAVAGTEYVYPITATGAEGAVLTLSAPVLPDWLELTDNTDGTGTLAGTPADEHIGDHAVELLVTDDTGASAAQAFTVTVAETTDEPAFTSAPVTSGAAGAEYVYPITATAAEGAVLTLTAPVLPDWLVLTDNSDGTGTLAGTPAEEHIGDHEVELLVTDDAGASASQAFTVTVSAAGAENNPPAFASSPTTDATAESAYNYTIEASDPDDGDALSITAAAVPDWLTLTDNGDGTATLSGTPADGDVGDHEITLQVADAAGEVAEQVFTVTVEAASSSNPPPPSTSTPQSSGGSGSTGLAELFGLGLLAMLIGRRRRVRAA